MMDNNEIIEKINSLLSELSNLVNELDVDDKSARLAMLRSMWDKQIDALLTSVQTTMTGEEPDDDDDW